MKRLLSSAAVVVVAWTCVACETSGNAPSGTTPSQDLIEKQESDASTESTDSSLILGPRGVGPLLLGMTNREVVDTGAALAPFGARHDGWPVGCRVLQYRPVRLGRTPGNTVNGALSAQQGLERIYATQRMVTPEGVHLGSTVDEVREAYERPNVRTGDLVRVPAPPDAVYRVQLSGEVVVSVSLELRDLDCNI